MSEHLAGQNPPPEMEIHHLKNVIRVMRNALKLEGGPESPCKTCQLWTRNLTLGVPYCKVCNCSCHQERADWVAQQVAAALLAADSVPIPPPPKAFFNDHIAHHSE